MVSKSVKRLQKKLRVKLSRYAAPQYLTGTLFYRPEIVNVGS